MRTRIGDERSKIKDIHLKNEQGGDYKMVYKLFVVIPYNCHASQTLREYDDNFNILYYDSKDESGNPKKEPVTVIMRADRAGILKRPYTSTCYKLKFNEQASCIVKENCCKLHMHILVVMFQGVRELLKSL